MGLAAFTLATILSVRPVRQLAFEFFLASHIILIALVLLGPLYILLLLTLLQCLLDRRRCSYPCCRVSPQTVFHPFQLIIFSDFEVSTTTYGRHSSSGLSIAPSVSCVLYGTVKYGEAARLAPREQRWNCFPRTPSVSQSAAPLIGSPASMHTSYCQRSARRRPKRIRSPSQTFQER